METVEGFLQTYIKVYTHLLDEGACIIRKKEQTPKKTLHYVMKREKNEPFCIKCSMPLSIQ